jgi:putative restriction endonuclease
MDDQIRLAAFEWLEKQTTIYGDVLPRILLEKGFIFQGERIILLGPQGIWKPKVMNSPLSIVTVGNRYEDLNTPDGFLNYKYQGGDPYHPDNVGLRKLILSKTPLIYFLRVVPGKYLVTWPVYVINDDSKQLVFTIAVDDKISIIKADQVSENESYYRRSYLTSTTLTRVHQRSFRERVLLAYKNHCALCNLRHIELLDAAHIIGDKDDIGDPIVQNGLALCKIHHAAFDNNFIGISPDYKIKVRFDLLEEIDGPMLKYGIQSLNNANLILPSLKRNYPDKERLEIRFLKFLKAG